MLVVLVFHAGFGWAKGGFLGVSTFFTLSGFLIATLCLSERGATGRLDLGGFWIRRARRLLPAAVAAVALAVVLVALLGTGADRRAIGGDALGALLYGANWHNVLAGQSYLDLLREPGPLLHMWSLAVEEQFYLLFPLVVMAAFWRARSPRQGRNRLAAVAATVVVLSAVMPKVLSLGFDRAYYGTDSRAAELAIGVLLACVVAPWMTGSGTRGPRPVPEPVRRGIAALSLGALGLMALAWTAVPDTAAWLFLGGLPFYALLSATVVLAAALGTGLTARILDNRVLRHLGLISYGAYLYHWPVYWALTSTMHMGSWGLLVVGGAITIGLAEVSRALLEEPIRRGRGFVGRRPMQLAPVALATGVFALVVAAAAPAPPTDFEAASAAVAEMTAAPSVPGATPASLRSSAAAAGVIPDPTGESAPVPVPPPPRAVAFYGDSTAVMSAIGIGLAADELTSIQLVAGGSETGCGLVRSTKRRYKGGKTETRRDPCNHWEKVWAEKMTASRPDIVVLQVGPWETLDFQRPGGSGWEHLGEPDFDTYVTGELTEAVDLLASGGARVVLVTMPPMHPEKGQGADLCTCPERIEAWNAIQATVAASRPDAVTTVDFAGWIAQGDNDATYRFDGIHLTPNSAARAAALDFWEPALRKVPLRSSSGPGVVRVSVSAPSAG